MKNIKNTKKIVQQVLEQNKQARDSDDLLYIKVCEKINPQSVYQPLKTVFAMRETLNLPPFESVRRARQKVQQEHPELQGSVETRKKRTELEHSMRNFARKTV